jgi:hypothetical protein
LYSLIYLDSHLPAIPKLFLQELLLNTNLPMTWVSRS